MFTARLSSPSSPYPDDSFAVIYTPRINPIYTSNSFPFPIQRIPPPPLSPFQNFPFESKIDQPIQEQQNIAPPLILSLNDSCCFLLSSCPSSEGKAEEVQLIPICIYIYTLSKCRGGRRIHARGLMEGEVANSSRKLLEISLGLSLNQPTQWPVFLGWKRNNISCRGG